MEPTSLQSEELAAFFQAGLTAGVTLLFGLLYRRYRRPYLGWWSVALGCLAARPILIVLFLATQHSTWLYGHQVLSGWAALALFSGAWSFERGEPIRRRHLLLGVVPAVAAYPLTLYGLRSNFILAASITVALLALATFWTGFVFLRFRRRTQSTAAAFLAWVFFLWGLHHLDYPILRAQGLLVPLSYYIDSGFVIVLSLGMLLLVAEELHRGLRTLGRLSAELHRTRAADGGTAQLLERVTGLRGITGCAIWYPDPAPSGALAHGIGRAAGWSGRALGGTLPTEMAAVLRDGQPRLEADFALWVGDEHLVEPFVGLIPVRPASANQGVVIVTGAAREPFTALDAEFWLALGQQIGGALENAELESQLRLRGEQLERLSVRLIQQHEDQRRRLSRELHDETAQVFSAMKLQLGLLGETAGPEARPGITRMSQLVDTGIGSIRSVVEDLRPTVLDDLGVVAALQSLVTDFAERGTIEATFEVAGSVPPIGDDAELAIFRTLQESLSNVVRHAEASRVTVTATGTLEGVELLVVDDGRGIASNRDVGRMGLVGMQERLVSVGGRLEVRPGALRGTVVEAWVPSLSSESS